MKNNKIIKSLSLILIFVLLFSVISTSAIAEEQSSNDDTLVIDNSAREIAESSDYSYGYNQDSNDVINNHLDINTNKRSAIEIPSNYDNSTSPYFPAIGDQGQISSCASFATTYYQFTFQANKLNNIITTSENTYCPNWTYNYINGGMHGAGSAFKDNYKILEFFGAATYKDYHDKGLFFNSSTSIPFNYQYWLQSDVAQANALKTRVSSWHTIPAYVSKDFTFEGLDYIKQKIAEGNILAISSLHGWESVSTIDSNNITENGEPISNKYDGQQIIACNVLGESINSHAVAIVGYDDELCFDANKNGTIETFEKGAFKIVNSWGTDFGNEGFIWVLYDAFNSDENSHIDAENGGKRESFIYAGMFKPSDENGSYFPLYYITVKNYECNIIGQFDFESNNRFAISLNTHHIKTVGNIDMDINDLEELPLYYKGKLFLDFDCEFPCKNKTWSFNMTGEEDAIEYAELSLVDTNANLLKKSKKLEPLENKIEHAMEFDYLKLHTGDLNFDGYVLQEDLVILNGFLEENKNLSALQLKLSDLNDDGLVNSVDCLLLSNKIAEETITKNNGVFEISIANSDIKVGLESEFYEPLSASSEFNHIQAGFIFENVKEDYFCIRSMHDPSIRLTNKVEFTEDGVVYKLSKKPYNENIKGVFNDVDLFKIVKCVDNSYKVMSKYNGKYLTLSENGELIFKNITENAIQSFSIVDSPIKIGDVNMDYSITDADATLLQSYLDNEIDLTITQLYLGNVVFDDELDIKDVYGIKALTNEYYFDYDGLTYLCTTYDTVQVCNYSFSETQTEYKGNIVIPSYATDGVMTFKVVKIGNDAFKDCTKLTSISDEGEIADISNSAFENCSSLQTVNFKKVKTVDKSAFENCSVLHSVDLGGFVYELKEFAFKNCKKLSYIYFNIAPYHVGNNAFENCESLSNIYIPYAQNIGNEAFKGCSSLNQIVLLEVTSIGNNAFDGCSLLKEIALPTTLNHIGTGAFANIENLTIFGKKDSLAEDFATESGIKFDKILYDWETADFHDGANYKISGLTSDTMVWRGTFEGSYDNIGLSNISDKSLKITNTMSVTKSLRAAISLPKNWLNEENVMKVWVGNFSGTVTFEFRGKDSMSYKKWIGTSKNGWISFPLYGNFYKNGPDTWEHTTVSKETISQAHTLWITFENMESGTSAYIDEIVLSDS